MMSLGQLSRYRFAGKSEQAIREEWIAPLLIHLGYGMNTLNEIRYEVPLRLAKPFRRIGRKRVDVDYLPTVLSHGLWIIEAKAAESEDWDDAISQAWLYATHPEIDVPFMAIADGSRFAIYDTQQPDWDDPVVDIATRELERRFDELARVIGAAHITRSVRERRLRHLASAMRAEINAARLREYVSAVTQLADEAQPAVFENYKTILRDQSAIEAQREKDAIAEAGMFAVGVWANRPFGVAKRTMSLGRQTLLRESPSERHRAFERLTDATKYGQPRVARQYWNFRLVRLFIALTCADEPGCEFLRGEARTMVRDHLLDFPDNALERAAHRLERILPVFIGRIARTDRAPDLNGIARQIQEHWSDEMRARTNLDGDHLYLDLVLRMTDQVWQSIPWSTDALEDCASTLEAQLDSVQVNRAGIAGMAGDPYFDWHYERDMLAMGTLYELGSHIGVEHLDSEILRRLKQIVDEDPDEQRMVAPAQRLIELWETRDERSAIPEP